MKKFFTLCALLATACFSAVAAEDLTVAPSFTGWAGSDNTVYTKGVVKMSKQYMQLATPGLVGMSDITVKVVLSEPFAGGFQLCLDYDGADSEWPQFTAGETELTVTTKDAPLKNFGIQLQNDGAMEIGVEGIYVNDKAVNIGGGWNDGFAGDADLYNFDITSQWGAAQFAVNQNVNDYSSIIIEFAEPCPAGFQVNVNYTIDATGTSTPVYNVVDPTGLTTVEVPFNAEWGNITSVDVQFTLAEGEAELSVKKATLKAGSATGVDAFEAVEIDAPAFNLMGQPTKEAKGLMIKGGQKVMVK